MKRHQIKRVICNTVVTVTDAQLRQAIADLNLPTEDGHDYDAEQVRAIINQFKSPTAGEPTAAASTDASSALTMTKGAIAASTNSLQQQALNFADRIQTGDRQLAKQLAGYLKDRPNRFAVMLAEEIHALTEPAQTPDFIDVSWGEMPALELPSVSLPLAMGGALPAAF